MTEPEMTILQQRIAERLQALGDAAASAKATEAGFSDSFIRDIIRGKTKSPRAVNMDKLASVLETTTDYLQGKTDIPTRPASADDPRRQKLMEAYDLLEEDLKDVAIRRVEALVPPVSSVPAKAQPEKGD